MRAAPEVANAKNTLMLNMATNMIAPRRDEAGKITTQENNRGDQDAADLSLPEGGSCLGVQARGVAALLCCISKPPQWGDYMRRLYPVLRRES